MHGETAILMQMNDAERPDGGGFAFTFALHGVPSSGDLIFVGGRRFSVVRVDWHPLAAHEVRINAKELDEL
jgi:hypothetical protein